MIGAPAPALPGPGTNLGSSFPGDRQGDRAVPSQFAVNPNSASALPSPHQS